MAERKVTNLSEARKQQDRLAAMKHLRSTLDAQIRKAERRERP